MNQGLGFDPVVWQRPLILAMHLDVLEHEQSSLLDQPLSGARVVSDVQRDQARVLLQLLADQRGEAAVTHLIVREVDLLHVLVKREEVFDGESELVAELVLPQDQALEALGLQTLILNVQN